MPEPIQFTTVSTPGEVDQILELQGANLRSVVSPETMASQGFVTVQHDPRVLQRMNDVAPAVIAKAGGRVVGYALVMPRSFSAEVPILDPMFQMLDGLSWQGELLCGNPRWFVMGQICIAKGFRGLGIFDRLYGTMAEKYRSRFDFTVTEVSSLNPRSMKAHARVGFQTLHVYPDPDTGEEWHVVGLDLTTGVNT